MISYWKTQWFRVVVACICLGLTIAGLFQPTSDLSTAAGIEESLQNDFAVLGWLCATITCFILSVVDWNSDNIEKLNKRLEALERKQESNNDI